MMQSTAVAGSSGAPRAALLCGLRRGGAFPVKEVEVHHRNPGVSIAPVFRRSRQNAAQHHLRAPCSSWAVDRPRVQPRPVSVLPPPLLYRRTLPHLTEPLGYFMMPPPVTPQQPLYLVGDTVSDAEGEREVQQRLIPQQALGEPHGPVVRQFAVEQDDLSQRGVVLQCLCHRLRSAVAIRVRREVDHTQRGVRAKRPCDVGDPIVGDAVPRQVEEPDHTVPRQQRPDADRPFVAEVVAGEVGVHDGLIRPQCVAERGPNFGPACRLLISTALLPKSTTAVSLSTAGGSPPAPALVSRCVDTGPPSAANHPISP